MKKLQGILVTFQFIEELLRMYIAYCYKIISLKVSKFIEFKYSYKDLQKDSLGTLISHFKKLSKKSSLIKNIEQIIKDRNYCAHEAYLLTYEQQKDSNYLLKEIKKLDEMISKTQNCFELLLAEVKQIEEVCKNIHEVK